MKKRINKNKLVIFTVFAVVFLASLFLTSREEVIADNELDTLEQKARNYQRMIDLKQQQQTTLQNQMKMMNLQINNYDNDIVKTQKEIKKNKEEAKELQKNIDKKAEEIENTKDKLREIIALFNQIDEEFSMELLLNKGDISSILNQSEYLDQTSQEIESILDEIGEKKIVLETERRELQGKNDELRRKEGDLREKIYDLDDEKEAKDLLIKKTRGEEAKYQQLLARVESQKLELIGYSSISKDAQKMIDKILKKAKKPKKNLASSEWYYSQKDPRWGSKRIGLSSTLMQNYGCAVTALSMVFTYHDEKIEPGKLAGKPIFYQDLIVWPKQWKDLNLISSTAHAGVDWDIVDEEIKNKNPVIVFVRAFDGKGHYVVVHGKYKSKYIVHDPIFGANLYLDTTKELVGAIYGGVSTTVDQMIIYHDDK